MPPHAGAALHSKAHRLVEDENVLVLVERDRLQEIAVVLVARRVAGGGLRRVKLEGRNANGLAGFEAVVRPGALAVDAEFALAHDALDVREGELGKARDQKAVDPHARLIRFNREGLNAGGERLLRGGFDLRF